MMKVFIAMYFIQIQKGINAKSKSKRAMFDTAAPFGHTCHSAFLSFMILGSPVLFPPPILAFSCALFWMEKSMAYCPSNPYKHLLLKLSENCARIRASDR
jgi:hypothetical protein